MKLFLRLEGLALSGLSIFWFLQLVYAWGWYPRFFNLPDLRLPGHLGGERAGAEVNNAVHHHAVSIGL